MIYVLGYHNNVYNGVYMYVLSLFLSIVHAIFYFLICYFIPLTKRACLTQVIFYHLPKLYWFYLMYLSEMTKSRCSIKYIHNGKFWFQLVNEIISAIFSRSEILQKSIYSEFILKNIVSRSKN